MNDKGSFVRWQSITITQLGYTVNVVLSLATASLGFSLSQINGKQYRAYCWGKAFMFFSLLLLAISVALGLWCVINRLLSFRHTTQAARARENGDESKHAAERAKNEILDPRTWLLFWLQIATFGFGMLFLIMAFAAINRTKLF